MSVTINLHRDILTDGSIVTNVEITKDEQTITLNAYDEKDAEALRNEIQEAINNYTADTVRNW